MILEIVQFGHPALRQKGKPVQQVTDDIRRLAMDMLETMDDANGVGLAAQQVGVPIQLTVIDVPDIEERPSTMWIDDKEVDLESHMPLILLNPKLTLSEERETDTEGCLSFPDITADIKRSAVVEVQAHDLDGNTIRFKANGLLARAAQHETDHLHGILFIDRMDSATKAALSGKLKRLKRENTH